MARRTGNAGPNKLGGTGNSDKIFGLGGKDTLKGKGGDDFLYSGTGTDKLYGGTGADKFVFKALNWSVVGSKHDTIFDFSQADGDQIDLSKIDGDTGTPGVQGLTFIGTDAFALHDGYGKVRYEIVGENTYIQIDLQGDGDSDPDLEIMLVGKHTLTLNDFLL
jgi:Ca2+-binding RTX toxin-like protein